MRSPRLTVGRGGPRDLGLLRDGLYQAKKSAPFCLTGDNALRQIVDDLVQQPTIQAFADTLRNALKDDLPFLDRDGNFIREGYSPKLDELRVLKDEGKRLMLGLESKYKADTGIDSLKISYNNVLGYFIEVPVKRADKLMVHPARENRADNPFIHRQTMASAVRFTTPELAEMERDMSSAVEKSLAIEQQFFDQFCNEVNALSEQIGTLARALATLDVTAALAELAVDQGLRSPRYLRRYDFRHHRRPPSGGRSRPSRPRRRCLRFQ